MVAVSVFGSAPEIVIISSEFSLANLTDINTFETGLKLDDTNSFETDLKLEDTSSFEIDLNKTETNLTEFWNNVRAQVSGDFLYPETFDATRVTAVLRQGKIINADLFKKQTSMKLLLTLQGGQTAIFKVKLE